MLIWYEIHFMLVFLKQNTANRRVRLFRRSVEVQAQFRLVSKHIILLWFWIHYYAYLFTFWNSFWPMCTTIQLLFVFSDTIFIWVHLHSLIHITMDDRNAFELGLKSEGNAFKCNHKIGRFLIEDFCCGL